MAETLTYDDLPGWEFVIEERSPGHYALDAHDGYGQNVSRQGADANALLEEARRWAAERLTDERPWIGWWQSTGLPELRALLSGVPGIR
jgi:hypothetical protein